MRFFHILKFNMVEFRNRSKKFEDLLENFSSSKECKSIPEKEELSQSNEYYMVMNTPTNEYVNLIQQTLPEKNSHSGKEGGKLLFPSVSQLQENLNLPARTHSNTKLERPATPILAKNKYQGRKLSSTVPNKPKLKPKPNNSLKITDQKGEYYYIMGGDTSQVNITPSRHKNDKIIDLKGDCYYLLSEDKSQMKVIPPKPKRVNILSPPSVAKDQKGSLKSNNSTRKPLNYLVISETEDDAISTPVYKAEEPSTSLPVQLTKSMIFEDFSIDSDFSNFASEIRTKYKL